MKKMFVVMGIVLSPAVAFAQDAGDAGPDAAVCPLPDDEVGPCRERSIGDTCTLSTGKEGACVQSECLTQIVCRKDAPATSGGCCNSGGGGGGGAAAPAIFVLGFAAWKRRRFAVTARRPRP